MNTIHNPVIPFNAPIPGGMQPGRTVRISGTVPAVAHRFAVNLLVGSMGDIALHVSPDFHHKHVIRNSVQQMRWGHEEKSHLPHGLHPGHTFDMLILCDPHHFKIAFNGHHFAEFHHRISYTAITNVSIDGEVIVHTIHFEGGQPAYGGGHMGLVPPVHSVHTPGFVPSPAMGHAPYPAVGGIGIPHHPSVGHSTVGHHAGSPYPHSPAVYPNNHTGVKAAKKQMKAQRKAQKKALKYGLPIAGAGIAGYALHKGLHHGLHGHHHHHHSSSSSSSSSSD